MPATGSGPARPQGRALGPRFFERSPDEVGRDLIGKILWRDGVGGGRLVEVEAYLPAGDPACHAHRGRTARNQAMFGPPGSLYLFVSYGIHRLLNLVCLPEGLGAAVLIRAIEPIGDTSRLLANRRLEPVDVRMSTSGPGRVGEALGLDLGLNSLMLGTASGIRVIDDGHRYPVDVTPRIGITGGRDLELRYILPGNPYVSRAPRQGRALTPRGRREQVDETR